MATIEKEACFIHLEWITSKPNLTQVVFSLQNKKNLQSYRYVTFYFPSFDLMYTMLRSFARTYKACSVENLYKQTFPAKIEYLKGFDSLDKFEALYLTPSAIEEIDEDSQTNSSKQNYFESKECLWPSNTAKGSFLWDDDIQ